MYSRLVWKDINFGLFFWGTVFYTPCMPLETESWKKIKKVKSFNTNIDDFFWILGYLGNFQQLFFLIFYFLFYSNHSPQHPLPPSPAPQNEARSDNCRRNLKQIFIGLGLAGNLVVRREWRYERNMEKHILRGIKGNKSSLVQILLILGDNYKWWWLSLSCVFRLGHLQRSKVEF
jgi:hypothetical protein